jgi:hypothetical protein
VQAGGRPLKRYEPQQGVLIVMPLSQMIAFGLWFGEEAYLRSVWNQLDFFILIVSFIALW